MTTSSRANHVVSTDGTASLERMTAEAFTAAMKGVFLIPTMKSQIQAHVATKTQQGTASSNGGV